MALFKITAKQNSHSNGLRLEKGMSVEVASKYMSNPIVVNGGLEVQDAFMRKYGLDLKKLGGGRIPAHLFEVLKMWVYEYRSDKRPIIIDLTTSEGSDFNSADTDNADIAYIDNLTFIYRDEYYNRDSQKTDKIELIQYDKENMEVIELDWPMCYIE